MENLVADYQKLRSLYNEFNNRIKDLLTSIINDKKIKYHLIESRTKSIESFEEKLSRKGNKYSKSIEEITDLVGIRIIVYYLDDVESIERIIKKEFIIDDENSIDKGKILKINEFGYQSVHYVVKLSENRKDLAEWKKFSNLKAEIQIRTVLQHSWASISHELEYKKKYEIPSILQRKLFRLAGLIELADEEFRNTRDQHNELVEKLFLGNKEGHEDNQEIFEELNLLTLKKYITESSRIKLIEIEAKRAGFKVLYTRVVYRDDRYIAEIINHCNLLNIKTISQLDKVLEDLSDKYFPLFNAQKNAYKGEWTANATFLILLLFIFVNINNIKDASFLRKQDWGTEIAERVLNVFRKVSFK